jgi:hypothetical protein
MKKIYILALFIMNAWASFAQSENKNIYTTLSIGNYSDLIQFKVTGEPIHKLLITPVIEAGIGKNISSKRWMDINTQLKLTYTNDTYVENIYGAGLDFQFLLKPIKKISIGPELGIYYNHAIRSDDVYAYDGTKWQSVDAGFKPRNRAAIKLGLALNFKLSEKVDFIANGKFILVTPYNKDIDIPFNAHKNVNAGFNYRL